MLMVPLRIAAGLKQKSEHRSIWPARRLLVRDGGSLVPRAPRVGALCLDEDCIGLHGRRVMGG